MTLHTITYMNEMENMVDAVMDDIDNAYDMGYINETPAWDTSIDNDELMNAFIDYETNGVTHG